MTKTSTPAQVNRCRLTLEINGQEYAVIPVQGGDGEPSRCFELRKRVGTGHYHVSQHSYGNACTCPDFAFRHDGLDNDGCKHVRACVACGLLDGSPASRVYAELRNPRQDPYGEPARPTGRPSPRNRVEREPSCDDEPDTDDFVRRGGAPGHH